MTRSRSRPQSILLAIVTAAAMLLAAAAWQVSNAQDTTYTTSADAGTIVGMYPHYFTLSRGSAVMGIVLQGNASAGSCANAWCALVPSNASNGFGQSGGTFPSFSAAAHEVVRVWNVLHPAPAPSPTPAPPPAPLPAPDTGSSTITYTSARIVPTPAGAITAYAIRVAGGLVGQVIQAPAGKWTAYRDGVALSPVYSTLRAAAERLATLAPITPPTPTPCVPETVTVTVTRTVHDTVPVIRVDTVFVPAPTTDTTAGLHIYDIPGRIGENSVWNGTTRIGRVIQDGSGRWWAYWMPSGGSSIMPQDPVSYSTMLEAMLALTKPAPSGTVTPAAPRSTPNRTRRP